MPEHPTPQQLQQLRDAWYEAIQQGNKANANTAYRRYRNALKAMVTHPKSQDKPPMRIKIR